MTAEFKSYSQAGQDRWVYATLKLEAGTFLDIGCSHPTKLSNTYALEQLGWRGILIDNDPNVDLSERKSDFIRADATTLDWSLIEPLGTIDYLSLDVDEATLAVLERLPLDKVKFRLITCEHDSYRLGNGPRDAMRRIFASHGYILVRPDVEHDGLKFEDWYQSTL